MVDKKPPPMWVTIAYRVVEECFDQDLDIWPTRARVQVLVAALDAEKLGDHAVEVAAHDAAKAIMDEWRRKTRPLPKRGNRNGGR